MNKIFCDFCLKEIPYTSYVTVTTDYPVTYMGDIPESEHHFHTDCYTRLKNKVERFIEDVRKDCIEG